MKELVFNLETYAAKLYRKCSLYLETHILWSFVPLHDIENDFAVWKFLIAHQTPLLCPRTFPHFEISKYLQPR